VLGTGTPASSDGHPRTGASPPAAARPEASSRHSPTAAAVRYGQVGSPRVDDHCEAWGAPPRRRGSAAGPRSDSLPTYCQLPRERAAKADSAGAVKAAGSFAATHAPDQPNCACRSLRNLSEPQPPVAAAPADVAGTKVATAAPCVLAPALMPLTCRDGAEEAYPPATPASTTAHAQTRCYGHLAVEDQTDVHGPMRRATARVEPRRNEPPTLQEAGVRSHPAHPPGCSAEPA
jgi:hypothetical protein